MNPNAHVMRALGLDSEDSDLSKKLDGILAAINKTNERLDNLESAIVATAKESELPGDQDSDVFAVSDYSSLALALDALKASLPSKNRK